MFMDLIVSKTADSDLLKYKCKNASFSSMTLNTVSET